MKDLFRLDALGKAFVSMCAAFFPFRKYGNLLYLCCDRIHFVLHSAGEILRWGDLINRSGEAAENTHKINVKGPGANTNHRDTADESRKSQGNCKEARSTKYILCSIW